MVFVNPAVRTAMHRRLAVGLRRHLDRLLGPYGYTYDRTQIEKSYVLVTYLKDGAELVIKESDLHSPSGATYTLAVGEEAATFHLESDLSGALEQLVLKVFGGQV